MDSMVFKRLEHLSRSLDALDARLDGVNDLVGDILLEVGDLEAKADGFYEYVGDPSYELDDHWSGLHKAVRKMMDAVEDFKSEENR